MSSSRFNKNGPNFVPAYQISGVPWATGSLTAGATAVEVKFPNVTRWVQITNNSANAVRVGFSKNGVDANPAANSNYFVVEGKSDTTQHMTDRLELRCKSIFLKRHSSSDATVSIVAGLTGVEEFPVLTGSNGFKGIG